MIALKDVQTEAGTLLTASAYFSGEQVILDDGTKEKDIEAALESRGFVVHVPPIIGGDLKSQGKDTATMDVDLMVCIEVNPAINGLSGKANKNICEAIVSVCAAMLAYDNCEKVPNSKFRLAPEGFNITTFHPGLHAYDVFFKRMCVV